MEYVQHWIRLNILNEHVTISLYDYQKITKICKKQLV